MTGALRDDPERGRFELELGEGIAFIRYRRRGRVLVLAHAEVPPALGGRGAGSRLVQATLDEIRRRGERVVPQCPFIARFIARHPAYGDLVASGPDDAPSVPGPL